MYALSLDIHLEHGRRKNNIVCTISKCGYGLKINKHNFVDWMGIADNKYDLRIIHKNNKDMTQLFGQFAAYMIKFNTTFGFTKVLFGGRPNFFPTQ